MKIEGRADADHHGAKAWFALGHPAFLFRAAERHQHNLRFGCRQCLRVRFDVLGRQRPVGRRDGVDDANAGKMPVRKRGERGHGFLAAAVQRDGDSLLRGGFADVERER